MEGVKSAEKPTAEPEPEAVCSLVSTILAECEVAMGSPARVQEACSQLLACCSRCFGPSELEALRPLFQLVAGRSGDVVVPLIEMLDRLCTAVRDPWSLLQHLLAVRDGRTVHEALMRTLALAESGSLAVDYHLAGFFADKLDLEGSHLGERENLAILAKVLRHLVLPGEDDRRDPVTGLYLMKDADGRLRRMAGRILDLGGEPASPELARLILGVEAYEFLASHLAFTRATHVDLLYLVPVPGEPPLCLPGLKRAATLCDDQLLREVISEVGWTNLNFGVEVHKYLGISIGGAFPLMVPPTEVSLFNGIEEARRTGETLLLVAHGGLPAETRRPADQGDTVARFRSYNLTHSQVLGEILDVAPLTRRKVDRILSMMDGIVSDFLLLFSNYAEECGILPSLYRELKERILRELTNEQEGPQVSPELTRLVQMFEDPRSLGEVRTLHGLKRYLHQRGLRLGFRLVESGRATNRTVHLVAASPKRVLHVARVIQYADFEPSTTTLGLTQVPYPVQVAANAFAAQIIHGEVNLPAVKIFLYGNEVHYYLNFLNHPAFLRIDYSPPLRGGMIDLEYFGVSKHELDLHPNIALDALQQFFRKLEFDVTVEKTHVRARYDKERALGLGDICEKAEALFRLAPYLMELDWVIGSLDLSEEAKKLVAESWAGFFLLWGVVPIKQVLTRKRRGILVAIESSGSGERETSWSGQRPYRDRFTAPTPQGLIKRLRSSLAELGVEANPLSQQARDQQIGQIYLENLLLKPLREAVALGEVIEAPEGFQRNSPEFFQRKHETEFFAEILSTMDDPTALPPSPAAVSGVTPAQPLSALQSSFLLAQLIAPLERTLRFQTSGSLNGFEVQRASMPLPGYSLGLYVLRDGAGIIRLALFSLGDTLCLRREDVSSPWRSNASIDPARFVELLRLNNYITLGMESVKTDAADDAAREVSCFRRENPSQRPRPIPGDNVIEGLRASPGRAVGRVLFGTKGRAPEDFDGAILVAPAITPEDNTFLYHALGVVSVGGGILSHAGLIAVQFRKPGLIIAGRWQEAPGERPVLLYRTLDYREEERRISGFRISVRRDVQKLERRLSEGDVVVLDADEGILRNLRQDLEVLGLHESMRYLGEASRRLARAEDENEILVLRGRRLRARHQIEKQLGQVTDLLLAHHVAQELFVGKDLAGEAGAGSEKARFLSLLLANPHVGRACRQFVLEISRDLTHRFYDRFEEARRRIPLANHTYEIASLYLRVFRPLRTLEETLASLSSCGLEPIRLDASMAHQICTVARTRLRTLRGDLTRILEEIVSRPQVDWRLRHLVRQIQRLDLILNSPTAQRAPVDALKGRIIREDETVRRSLQEERVLGPDDGGFDLYSLIGWKAANLAEIERLGGRGLVPPWFVITDRAFQEVLDTPLDNGPGHGSLRRAIEAVLARHDLTNGQKSIQIAQLWERASIPSAVSEEVLAAYRRFAAEAPVVDGPEGEGVDPFVAVRSSGREEDTESATRAGEFDTFLFIRGEGAIITHLKRAWSGLWTERAIHNRAVLGTTSHPAGGGIIVQRMVLSRVSGVLQTVNVAEDKHTEMVINAGLGLGEGIVSGTVAADLIFVAKSADLQSAPLHFRYITSDKQERVVLDARTGMGTVRSQTLYHQRLRPALEYVELVELVRIADRLEGAYGYPLDIEFGIEGPRLWILQARPVGTFPAMIRELTTYYPLAAAESASPVAPFD
jgi:phosphoenolpyruvate synthase/pyruvate phosphate dikinase